LPKASWRGEPDGRLEEGIDINTVKPRFLVDVDGGCAGGLLYKKYYLTLKASFNTNILILKLSFS
jgi:hypothetical protein